MTVKIGYTKTSRWAVGFLLVSAVVAMAAAPLFTNRFVDIGDFTVTAQAAACKDSIIASSSDSSTVTLSVSGVAVFDRAGETFTVGFGNGGGAGAGSESDWLDLNLSNLESSTISAPRGTTGTTRVPFNFRWILYTIAVTDTYYVQTSGVSPGGNTNIGIEDMTYLLEIGDRNAAN